MNSESFDLFVPGRLCLFGEHSDWAGAQRAYNADIVPGEAIVTGIEQGIYAAVSRSDRFILSSSIPGEENKRLDCPMDQSQLKSIAREGEWFSYVAGVASYMHENYRVGGLEIRLKERTLPVKRGLSSSAAICVLVAKAFNRMYDLRLSTKGEMQAAYLGEQRTPSRCGRLDQACAFGVRPVHMEFSGNDMEVRGLTAKVELYYVFADLMSEKDTIKILAALNRSFPFPQTALDRSLHEAFGKDNHDIVQRALKLMEEGNASGLGALMSEAQELFDKKVAPACPSELMAPALHRALADPTIRELIYGGKGVGSQGDGTVQFLAKNRDCQRRLAAYLREQLGMDAFELTLQPQYSIKRAIIPVAGYGTRLYPATHFIRKEFLPLVDKDGLAKPVILILLEELDRAGIEHICLVVGSEEDRELYEKLFKDPHLGFSALRLPEKAREAERFLKRIGDRIEYVIQDEQRGFGHAVYQCREFTGEQAVLLLLGDTVYRSHARKTCTEQLLEAFEQTKKTTVSVHRIPLKDVAHYGVLAGKWVDAERQMMAVEEIVEKPTVDYARDFLATPCEGLDSAYFSVFGEYVLTPRVFDILQKNIERSGEQGDEVQLTDALEETRKKEGLFGFAVRGEMYDTGMPEAYLRSIASFARK